MESFGAVLGFVLRRMRDSWRIQLVIAAGILVAAVLMSSTTIYTRAVSDLSLTVSLREDLTERRQMFTFLNGVPMAGGPNESARVYAGESIDERFGEIETQRLRFRTTVPTLIDFPLRQGQVIPTTTFFAALDDAEENVTVVEGRFPQPPVLSSSGGLQGPIEVALTPRASRLFGADVGTEWNLVDGFDECDREPDPPPGGPPPPPRPPCEPTMAITRYIPLVVTGIVEPDNTDSSYWSRVPREITFGVFSGPARPQTVPLIIPAQTFEAELPRVMSGYLVNTTWISELDTDQLNVAVLDDTREAFDLLREDLRSVKGAMRSPIEPRLESFVKDLNFTQVPILMLLAQVVGIALFYVVIVSGVQVAQRREELFSMRSRGASILQVISHTAIEGILIAIVAAAIAPFIAVAVIGLLGYTPVFEPLTGGASIPTTLTDMAFLLSAAGAIVAVLFTLAPLVIASRTRVLSERLRNVSRPAGPNALQRYFLDVALVLVAVGLIFEADLKGTVFERNSVGGLSADPLLLSTPILFALAATLVILRFLPYLYRFFAWLTYDRFPLSIASTLRYVSRTVGPAARLTILLMLGAALGTFAASYADTVELSLAERIEYDNGVEFRVGLGESGYSTANGVRDRLGPIDGVEGIASVYRSKVSAGRSIGTTTSVTILGIEPKAGVEMMWFREDLSLLTFEELISTIDVPPVGRGVGIPQETETLRVWIRMGAGETDQSFWLRVRDGDGRYHTGGGLAMPASDTPWTAMDIDFQQEIVGSGAAPPYSLHSLVMSEPFGLFISEPATIYIDAVTAIQPDGRELIIEDFENRRWLEFVQRRGTGDEIEFARDDDPISGEHVMAFRPGVGQSPGLRAAHFADPSFCSNTRCTVPTIVSADFAERQRLEVGDRYPLRLDSVVVTAQVASIVELFPTLRPDELSFIVADYDALFHMGSVTGLRPSVSPTEVWLDLVDDPALREATKEELSRPRYSLGRFFDRDERLDDSGRDPLTTAGGSGILLVAFIAISLLLALAFLVSMAVSARQRRLEMALLRTVGVGNLSILIQLFLEYAIIVGTGLVLGVLLGNRISLLLLAYLEIDERGRTVLPPFQIETDWQILGIAFAVLIGVLVIGVLATWRWFLKLELNRELRLTN
ncbi:MAG: FtsX-like permease family protein [Chloroflexota bacterium]|nr:FtsX-like permease family protein [Chloroflexota bacterium]